MLEGAGSQKRLFGDLFERGMGNLIFDYEETKWCELIMMFFNWGGEKLCNKIIRIKLSKSKEKKCKRLNLIRHPT